MAPFGAISLGTPFTTCAAGCLGDKFQGLDKRITAYRDEPVHDWRAHDLVIHAVGCRAITTSQVPDVVQEWREPSHSEFRPRNPWSLFNSFTEAHNPFAPCKPSPAARRCTASVMALWG